MPPPRYSCELYKAVLVKCDGALAQCRGKNSCALHLWGFGPCAKSLTLSLFFFGKLTLTSFGVNDVKKL